MREIKFRAWDNKNEKFHADIFGIDDSGQIILIEQTSIFDYPKYIVAPNCTPLQYTGLKDINGKEIYEGDILKSDMEVLRVGEVVYDEDNARFALKYKEEIPEEIYTLSKEIIQKLRLKVIGNIYENKKPKNCKKI